MSRKINVFGYTNNKVLKASVELGLNESFDITEIEGMKRELLNSNNSGEQITKFVVCDTASQHICQYCKEEVVDGTHIDLLCTKCRMTFGHALYSEL